jgi:hypothetical protein
VRRLHLGVPLDDVFAHKPPRSATCSATRLLWRKARPGTGICGRCPCRVRVNGIAIRSRCRGRHITGSSSEAHAGGHCQCVRIVRGPAALAPQEHSADWSQTDKVEKLSWWKKS